MRALAVLSIAAAAYGGVHLMQDRPAELAEPVPTPLTTAETYTLVANGDEACTVTHGTRTDGANLSVSPECAGLMPGIEKAKYWQEQEDGSIAFSADGIDPVVTFSIADGDGYESFQPALPLLSLAAR